MNNRITIFFLILFFTSHVNITLADDVFQWTDENGQVHFGSSPPKPETAKKINVKPANSFKNPHPENKSQNTIDKVESTIPSHVYKGFYKNNKLKYQYTTRNGNRIDPTFEYYRSGDLKQKRLFSKNLLKEPLIAEDILIVHSINIITEYKDSIKFQIQYELLVDKKSWLSIRPKPLNYFDKKYLPLLPSKKTGTKTGIAIKTLALSAPDSLQSEQLIFRVYNGANKEWFTLGYTDFIKIWEK